MTTIELRIHNFISNGGIVSLVILIDSDGISTIEANQDPSTEVYQLIDNYSPIPITEDWLIKFGFNKEAGEHWCEKHEEFEPVDKFYKGRFCIYRNPETGEYTDFDLDIEIKYVHQLQNLCHALTGEELIYN